MPAETAGDVGQNRVTVVELDRKCCAGEHLTDAAVNLERLLFVIDVSRLNFSYFFRATSNSDRKSSLTLPDGACLNPNNTRRVAAPTGQRSLPRLIRIAAPPTVRWTQRDRPGGTTRSSSSPREGRPRRRRSWGRMPAFRRVVAGARTTDREQQCDECERAQNARISARCGIAGSGKRNVCVHRDLH